MVLETQVNILFVPKSSISLGDDKNWKVCHECQKRHRKWKCKLVRKTAQRKGNIDLGPQPVGVDDVWTDLYFQLSL